LTRLPRHLWRGDWRADSESAREAAEREREALRGASITDEEAPTLVEPRPEPASRRRRTRALVAAGLVAGAIAIVAIAATALIGGSDESGPSALPAVSGKPVKPRSGETRTGAIYRLASPAVVSIRTDTGSGTGFVIDRNGTIVTNSHVVGSSQRVAVRFGPDSDSVQADVLGSDPSSDLAVVGIDPKKLPAGVRPLRLADSRSVRVGDVAIAIGNPFGLDRTATEGIVSGVGREIQAPNGFSIDSVIQTDAPINPGNSGGPLLNDSGQVIGVNSQIETGGSAGNVGVGFAVPSNAVRQVVPVLARGESIKRAYLGLQSTPHSPSALSGAEVQSVILNAPADRAGVRTGDVITRVDDTPVREPSDVSAAIADNKPGDRITIQVQRNGSIVNLTATLGTRPGATP
jgi:S1-C subfamily serine protease